jgi:AcrR family transcriptional regulator
MSLVNSRVTAAPRQRIIAGARRHFLAHGFRGVTMDDLADELGMSKKTLYAHFPSKQALLEATLLDKFHDLEHELATIAEHCQTDFPVALKELLACVHRHADEVRPPFVRDIQREAPELFGLIERRRAALLHRFFGKLLVAGRRVGMVRKDISTRLIIEILLAATQGVANPHKVTELGLTPKTALSAIISVVLEGVLTTPGRAKR